MLEVKDINLYYGAAQALRGVSISAEPGKVMCVLAVTASARPACCGRWSVNNPIASGSITFDGTEISSLKPTSGRAGIGFVPQGREIFPLLTWRKSQDRFRSVEARKPQYSR